ncbi:B- and T-lymphocyte attenuator [Austrofundulus limnaeus]|uniref:B- and T-lymphocyte attenuator n=1 Tax=Austrofundulus limnaeus TaxID=52670 RepID=A0A2I4CT46_AUSLI|nr:PREDICTED: B- and T-lymphocyte attenuator [Austrofundulus limnaeus]
MKTGSIMRPNSCWTLLDFCVLARLFLSLKADSKECTPGVMVRRQTVYTVHPGEELRVECPVEFCSSSPPAVYWVKNKENLDWFNITFNSHIKTEWKTLKQNYGVSYLIFQNFLKSDSGRYQCKSEGSISHTIFINTTDHYTNNETSKEKTNDSTDTEQPADSIIIYVYCAAGTASFIIIVIVVSVVSMRGCKRKPNPETKADNQYMEIPMAERPATHTSSLQASPRGSPSLMPSRRSSERKTPGHLNELMSANNEHLYAQRQQSRHRERNTAPSEDGSSVVYAALNHEAPPRTAARLQIMEEKTEYAAIRLV